MCSLSPVSLIILFDSEIELLPLSTFVFQRPHQQLSQPFIAPQIDFVLLDFNQYVPVLIPLLDQFQLPPDFYPGSDCHLNLAQDHSVLPLDYRHLLLHHSKTLHHHLALDTELVKQQQLLLLEQSLRLSQQASVQLPSHPRQTDPQTWECAC